MGAPSALLDIRPAWLTGCECVCVHRVAAETCRSFGEGHMRISCSSDQESGLQLIVTPEGLEPSTYGYDKVKCPLLSRN